MIMDIKLKNYLGLLPIALSFLGFVSVFYFDKVWIIVPYDYSFHFSLITVNALFGGFLYTNYSLLIGVLDNKIVEKVRNTSIIEKRNQNILRGIMYATISATAGLLTILIPMESYFLLMIKSLMVNIEIVFLFFLIFFFVLSLIEMHILIKHISMPINKKTKEEIAAVKKIIRGD